nr:MAG: capsid protein [Picornaviridae sp.]
MEKYNISTDNQELMTYFRQGIRSETRVLPSMSQVQNANELTLQDRRHDLLNFVSRPIDVFKGTWSVTNAQNDELIPAGLLFPDLLYQNAQYQEKMRGFVGLRGSIKVRILMNAQKFQQGLLMAYWIPNYKNLVGKAGLIQASLAGKSGCAHVIINCEAGTEQTIEIPYVNQHTFYNATTDQGNYGALFLVCLSQLKSTISGDSVGFRIQAWLDNPELEYPTAVLPVLTQGMEEEMMHANTADPPSSTSTITLNDLLDAVQTPSMKPSYIAKTAGNLLQLAGYQKPTNIAGVCRSSLRTNSYMANFGGEQMAHKLALAANNELMSMPDAGGSFLDEMNITNIVKAPTYYKTFSVDVTNGENYVLFTDNVHPAKFVQTGTEGVMNSSFVGYVSSCFGQWRGSMKYNFLTAKTGFHSGTVRVTWIPGLYAPFSDPTTLPPLINLDRCYQETYDLRDMTEFSFTVPYTSTREFLNIINPFSEGEQNVAQHNYSTGVLVVDVFVPVRAPEQITQNFDIVVFVSGGDDLVFANPTAPNIYPYTTVSTQGISFDEQHNRVQAIESTDTLVGAASFKYDLTPSALCTGEVITSIKNLMGRFGTFYAADSVATIDKAINVAPFDFQKPVTAATFSTAFPFDYIDFFSYLFGFYRGGVRLTMDPGYDGFHTNTTTHVKMRSSLNTYYPNGDIPRGEIVATSTFTRQSLLYPFATQVVKPSIEGTIDVEVPYYSLSHVTPVLVKEQTQDQVEESNYPFPIVTFLQYGAPTSPLANYLPTIFRSCADDFRFQYMLGPPQVHFTQYSTIPADQGVQYHNVKYSNQAVSRVGNAANGLFGQSFTFAVQPSTTVLHAPNQFLAVSIANDEIFLMPEDDYQWKWSTTGNRLLISGSTYTIPTDVRLLTNTCDIVQASPTLAWTFYTVYPPSAGPQASPFPCASFKVESISRSGNISVTIPSQSASAIPFGTDFTLTKPLLTANTDNDYIVIASGTIVHFEAIANNVIAVTRDGLPAGRIIYSLNANVGITTNTFSPTLVVEL